MTEPFKRHGTTYYLTDEEYDALAKPTLIMRIPNKSFVVHYDDVQARSWLADVLGNTQPTPMGAGDCVAMTLARLVGDDSVISTPWRRLSGAVGGPDWFTRDGVSRLVKSGWLRVETVGKGRKASTTFYLTPGTVVEREEAFLPEAA